MKPINRPTISDIRKEIQIQTARSGGPGGQHVNKVETKVILSFNVKESKVLGEIQKEMINARHAAKLTKEGALIVTCDSKRSQVRNREIAFKKLDRLLAKAFEIKKARKATKPSKSAIKERLKSKKALSEKKQLRKKIDY